MRVPRAAFSSCAILVAIAIFVTPLLPQNVVTTIAGTDWLFPADGRQALEAPLGGVVVLGIAVDKQGNYYIADPDNIMVFKVTPDGILTVVAGNGILGYSGDGGPATSASMLRPLDVAVDSVGNLYITDAGLVIRKVTPDGIISTFAGTGEDGSYGDGGPAISAAFSYAYGLRADSSGTVYVADQTNNRIRKITPDGIISTVAGNGIQGFSGDGGPATRATLNLPDDVVLDAAGNLYITDDGNSRVRMVTPQGIISTVAGGGTLNPAGGVPALSAKIRPGGITADPSGVLYVGDYLANRIVKVSNGIATTIAGNGKNEFSGDGGPALQAGLNRPTAMGLDTAGNLYIADSNNHRVRKVDLNGNIDTIAGNGQFRYSGEGGPATSATLFHPSSIAVDKSGNLYICEVEQSRIRKVDSKGITTTFAGTGRLRYSGDGGPAVNADLWLPSGVATDSAGAVYIADQTNSRVRKVTPDGIISTAAGNGDYGFSGDGGPATGAALFGPQNVLVDSAGNLYISDTGNDRVRKVTPDGIISTIAGNGREAFSGDGGPATAAALNQPAGLRLDAQGNLYIADSGNNRIRKVTPQGVISTLAGNGRAAFSGDSGQGTLAALNNPLDMITDAAGNIYIADFDNFRVRRVTPDGVISTIAGAANQVFSGDGGPAASANLGGPSSLAFDAAGDLLVADLLNNRIRAILVTAPTFQSSANVLTFTAESGGLPAPAQTVQVAGSIPGLVFGELVNPASATWLQATPAVAVMPAGVQVSADPTGLTPGTYEATVALVSPYTVPLIRPVGVTLTVTPARPVHLAAKPDGLSFSLVQRAPRAVQTITVSNQGGGSLDVTVAAATVSGGAWLAVSPAGGTATPAISPVLQVTADPTGLAPGTYSGAVTIASPTTGENATIPVVMAVSAVQQTIRLLQSGLTFTAVVGGGVTPAQSFGVQNIGQGLMNWSTSASVLSGESNWLSVTPDSGTSDAASTDSPNVQVSVDPTGLPAGNYYGGVVISAPGTDNSPQAVSVVLSVLPAGSNPGPIVQPAGLIFTGAAGAESPGSQIVTVANLTNSGLTFTSGRTTVDGSPWFVHLPTQATLPPQQAARIVVQPNLAGLAPGIYRGTLTLQFSGGSTRAVSLVFVVTATAASSPKLGRRAQGGCSPSKLAPVFTSLADSFAVPAAWPSTVGVRVIDDCGSPMVTGSAVATFSNGDPAQVLKHTQNGNWNGTWQPRSVTSSVTITVSAEIPEFKLKGSAQVSGGLRTNQSVPVITPGAVLSSASLVAQAPIAPGSLISILGSSLADSTLSSTTLPLPTDLAGASVLIAGRLAPVSSVSDGRIDAIVPYDVPPNTQHQVIVQKGAVTTVPQTVTVAPAQPAIFTEDKSGTGQASVYAAQDDGTQILADSAHPVTAGDNIVIQCAGLGTVDPAVPAGAPAPDSPPSVTVNAVTVSIGGVNAPVTSAQLAPGLTGVYQVQARVPAGVDAGPAVPIVVSAAGQLSPAVTIAVR